MIISCLFVFMARLVLYYFFSLQIYREILIQILNCLLLYFFNVFFVFSDYPDSSDLRRPVCGAKVRILFLRCRVHSIPGGLAFRASALRLVHWRNLHRSFLSSTAFYRFHLTTKGPDTRQTLFTFYYLKKRLKPCTFSAAYFKF